ncbi:ATP-grasp domain-containing protein [Cohnella terricola]|uniref:ATP-grasp domain-containing protein n=1 Tax=Cohnella terricola TaxID=1289167 RepID=A0A559JQA3_9BACL|nr:ATP-grasp domain-containing protein [Cohnella terricola]TVY02033.1 ATP-grasp domain-containing protein [Cohnella terricola]
MTINAESGAMRILLTGGRSPAALELARLFQAAGHRVFAAESAPYHLCRVSRFVERSFAVPDPANNPSDFAKSLRSIIETCGIDILVPTCEEIFHIARESSWFEGVCQIFAPTIDELERLHHKGKFIRLSEHLGFKVPETLQIESPEEWVPLLEDARFKEGIVLKPAYSRFASRTQLLDTSSSLLSVHQRQEMIRKLRESQASPRYPWVAQQLLRGEEWCTYSVAHGGELAAHVAYRSRFRAGRGATIHYAPSFQPLLLDWVRRFVEQIGFTGQIAFDFMILPDGTIAPLECNPRATSGVHLFGTNGGLAEAILSPSRLLGAESLAMPASGNGQGAMLSAAMLSYGLLQAAGERAFGQWLRAFWNSRDVVYRRDDPKPFLEQFRLLAWTSRIARRNGLTMQEASTLDIEWNGDR